MKKMILISLLLSLGLYAGEKFSLEVSVDKLRGSDRGSVHFALYNRDGTIPDKGYKRYYQKHIEKISNNSSHTIFKNLPKGRYAVSILHDENSNGKVDMGLLLPEEGVGFTNYKSINLMNKPNFKKASFELNLDMKKSITVLYF